MRYFLSASAGNPCFNMRLACEPLLAKEHRRVFDWHFDPVVKTENHRPAILIVDDTPANLGVLFDLLSDSGFEVLIAEDGASALERGPPRAMSSNSAIGLIGRAIRPPPRRS